MRELNFDSLAEVLYLCETNENYNVAIILKSYLSLKDFYEQLLVEYRAGRLPPRVEIKFTPGRKVSLRFRKQGSLIDLLTQGNLEDIRGCNYHHILYESDVDISFRCSLHERTYSPSWNSYTKEPQKSEELDSFLNSFKVNDNTS